MIWIEILSRQREVLIRQRFEGETLSIGRGYGNDIVLDDPHMAPSHLSITRDTDGRLMARDLGSLNGLYLDGGTARQDQIVLDGEGAIRIGQTLIRIRDESFAVAAERPLVVERRRWPLLVLLSAIILGIELIGAWRGDFREFKAATYIQPLLTVIAMVGIWVGVWTLLSRLLARVARFEANLLIGLVAMLTVSVANEIADFGAFALSWADLVEWRFAIGFIVMGAAAFAHMRLIGPRRIGLKLAGAIALPVVMIGYHAVIDADQQRTLDPPTYVHLLFPPGFRLSPIKSEDGFLADLTRMKGEIDQGRARNAQ